MEIPVDYSFTLFSFELLLVSGLLAYNEACFLHVMSTGEQGCGECLEKV